MNILIILGHPRSDSLCAALADAFEAGSRDVGLEPRRLDLAALTFTRDVVRRDPADQHLEPDLAMAQGMIAWADHIAIVAPVWWGTMPALLKAFLDRVLTPGFAFQHASTGSDWYPLLAGKTGQLLMTLDTPRFVYRWIYRAPATSALAQATLGFCGVRPVRTRLFGPVITSSPAQRQRWLDRANHEGRRLAAGYPGPVGRATRDALAWLRALRLQFYPMSWAAYTIGALLVVGDDAFHQAAYWWGYAALFLLEAATVFVNDLVDFETDSLNAYSGPFNGGSRVLVSGAIERRSLWRGAAATFAGAVGAATIACQSSPAPLPTAALFAIMAILALGYTAPPLKLAYRTLGEIDVSFTHSLGMILCGTVIMGGSPLAATPWLVGVPLFLSILPAITLSGLPDRRSDAQVAKRTLAVRWGAANAIKIAMAAALGAAGAALLWPVAFPELGKAFQYAGYAAALHGIAVMLLCHRYRRAGAPLRRIDGLMMVALSFILWFSVAPLVDAWDGRTAPHAATLLVENG